jgi:ABC-type transport system substrate-binding protein
MTKDRRKPRLPNVSRPALGALAVIGLLLSACSSATTQPTTEATALPASPTSAPTLTPSPIPPTETPAPTSTPLPPKPVMVALAGEPDTLHPLYATSQAAQAVMGALYVGCIGQDETGAPVALGCTEVPTLENGGAKLVGEGDAQYLEVTFHIRDGWRWTDGEPVTSEDALYAWQVIMSPEAGVNDALTQKVYRMSAPDARTIVVSFMSAAQARDAAAGNLHGDVPFEYFSQRGDYAAYAEQAAPLADAYYWAVVRWLPQHLLKDVAPVDQLKSSFAEKPIGDGAFELSAWNKGSDLTLARSKQPFPLETQGNVPGIIFKFAKDEAGMAALVQSGDAQLSQPLAAGALSATDVVISPVVAPLMEQIVLNTGRFPFDDVKVRQALRLAINAGDIISDPLAGPVTTAMVLDPSSMFYGIDDTTLRPTPDVAKAKALLAEAGWLCDSSPCVKSGTDRNGAVVTQTLVFTLVTNERQPRNALSQVIQQQLGQVGFGVDIQIVHGLGKASQLFAAYDQGGILLTRNFDAAMYQAPSLTRFSGVFDCASIPSETASAPTQGNAFGYCDQATDALIAAAEQGQASLSATERSKAIGDVLNVINENALFVPLYSPISILPSREVGGLKYTGVGVLTWNAWEWQQLAQP